MTVFLRMLYLRTEQDLLKELNRLRENGFVEYGTYASLMRVQAILQEMQDESFQYVPQAINKVFNETNKRLGYKAAEALSVPQTAIAEQLAGNLLGNINEAAETAYRTSEPHHRSKPFPGSWGRGENGGRKSPQDIQHAERDFLRGQERQGMGAHRILHHGNPDGIKAGGCSGGTDRR